MIDRTSRAALLFARWRPSYAHPRFGRAFGRLVGTELSRAGSLVAHFQRPFADVVDVYGTRDLRDRFGRPCGIEPKWLSSRVSSPRHPAR